MKIQTSQIFVPKRLRQDYGDLMDLAKSLTINGQLQAILVRRKTSDDETQLPWVLHDGNRRLQTISKMHSSGVSIKGLEWGEIIAVDRDSEEPEDQIEHLRIEFEANRHRLDFNWMEQFAYILRIHRLYREKEGSEWAVADTAEMITMGKSTVFKYLQFAAHPKAFKVKAVQEAKSFNEAWKKFEIAKALLQRAEEIKARKALQEKQKASATEDSSEGKTPTAEGQTPPPLAEVIQVSEGQDHVQRFVGSVYYNMDCRTLAKLIPANSVDMVHWDPPYGMEQRGGASTTHERIDDSQGYATHLLEEMIPEIHRVLKPGRWLAIWTHQKLVSDISRWLSGHRLADDGPYCKYCGNPWDGWMLDDSCPITEEPRFWVNPYPYVWYKTDRKGDGHEIKRYSVNAYETFLLAAKDDGQTDIVLPKGNRQNVFPLKMPETATRRHIMQKPRFVLDEILRMTSLPREIIVDFSVGSGTIFESAWSGYQHIIGCELDEQIYARSRAFLEEYIQRKDHLIEMYDPALLFQEVSA